MSGQEIRNALIELGAVIESEEGFNLDEGNDNTRIDKALNFLKRVICPYSSRIVGTLEHRIAVVVTLISDTVIMNLLDTNWPVNSIAKEICMTGIEKFCKNPIFMINE